MHLSKSTELLTLLTLYAAQSDGATARGLALQPNQVQMQQLQRGFVPAGDNSPSSEQQETGMALFGGPSERAGGLWSQGLLKLGRHLCICC